MNNKLVGQVAVVTGGASGIGRSTVLRIAGLGAHVVVLDRNEEGATAVVREVELGGGNATPTIVDLEQTERLGSVVAGIVEQRGRVDVLINCAGVRGGHQRLLDVDDDLWDSTFRVNLTAPMVLTKHVARNMIEQDEGGSIVNVSSTAGFIAGYTPAYSCSKAALHQLTRGAANELARYRIRVNTVAPGLVDTPGLETITNLEAEVKRGGRFPNPLERAIQADEITDAIMYLIQPSGVSITGQVIHVNAGALM